MAHTPEAVANEFIVLADRSGRKLTQMQLQKLVYIAHGWTLAITGEPLVYGEPHAWQWGPVYPSLYDALKRFGSGPVKSEIRENNWINLDSARGEVIVEMFTETERDIIQRVWDQYGDLEAFQLSALTHNDGTPWSVFYDGRQDRGIPNNAIRDHFLDLAGRRAA